MDVKKVPHGHLYVNLWRVQSYVVNNKLICKRIHKIVTGTPVISNQARVGTARIVM